MTENLTNNTGVARVFLCGDVMTGRGIDQILQQPVDPELFEQYVQSALAYVELAEIANGPVPRMVAPEYVWGDAIAELDRRAPHARIINLETTATESSLPEPKGINYRMSPANFSCITSADIDCCVLANNHVLDWRAQGLLDTLAVLKRAGVKQAGAGHTADEAQAPAIVPVPHLNARILIFGMCTQSCGVPHYWRAEPDRPGVNLLEDLSGKTALELSRKIRSARQDEDIVIASIHWGGNWGYGVPKEHRAFAQTLIDDGEVDIVHGHSSHHAMGIEVYRGKLILYGCGDLLNDYEGIKGYEEYRPHLGLMYFAEVLPGQGLLCGLEMVPMRVRKFRLERATREDARWLDNVLDREGTAFSTHTNLDDENCLWLAWD